MFTGKNKRLRRSRHHWKSTSTLVLPEVLEVRCLLSGSPPVQLAGTTLIVNGTPLDDTISVTEAVNLIVTMNGVDYTFTPAKVSVITILGNAGNDSITLNSLLPGIQFAADGGDGTIR